MPLTFLSDVSEFITQLHRFTVAMRPECASSPSRSVSEYSEFAGFDHKALWFGPKQATTCDLKDDFSDTLLEEEAT